MAWENVEYILLGWGGGVQFFNCRPWVITLCHGWGICYLSP